jgi:hypothetical protein
MMETKKLIKEKLNEEFNPHKRLSMVKAVMQKCANHLFDAYRELDMAIQYCDNPIVRAKLEAVRELLGNDIDSAGYMDSDTPSVITNLQSLANEVKP